MFKILSKAKYEAMQAEIQRLKGGAIPQEWAAKTQEVFTLDGHKYFEFKDLTQIPWHRGQELESALTYLSMGVDRYTLKEFIKAIRDAYDKGDPMKLAAEVGKLENRLEVHVVPDLLNHISAIIYFRDDEDPNYIDTQLINRKKTDFAKNPQLHDFFLLRTYRKFYEAGKQSDTLLLAHLKKLQMIIQADMQPSKTKTGNGSGS